MAARAMIPVLLALLVQTASAVDVTSCTQQIPASTVGVLQSDLACSATSSEDGLMLGDRASLQLNGHTLTNGAVLCSNSCAIAGPGTLSGGFGILALGNLRADGSLTVQGGGQGVMAFGRGTLTDLTVSGVVDNFGIEVHGTLRATNVTSNGSRIGIAAEQKLVGQNISTNDNAYVGIITAGRLRVSGLTASGNGFDPDNGRGGVIHTAQRGGPRLYDSTVTGNFFKGTTALDLLTTNMPHLVRSTCDHSAKFESTNVPTDTWGVCTQD